MPVSVTAPPFAEGKMPVTSVAKLMGPAMTLFAEEDSLSGVPPVDPVKFNKNKFPDDVTCTNFVFTNSQVRVPGVGAKTISDASIRPPVSGPGVIPKVSNNVNPANRGNEPVATSCGSDKNVVRPTVCTATCVTGAAPVKF